MPFRQGQGAGQGGAPPFAGLRAGGMIVESRLPDGTQRWALMSLANDRLRELGYVQIGFDHFARPDDPMVLALQAGKLTRHFQGDWGEGAATLIGAVAVISPLALVPVIAVWLATVMLTGFVGLGTMLGTATLPVYFALAEERSAPLVVFGLAMAAFVAYTHRANIERMRAGNENRARRLWLLRPR